MTKGDPIRLFMLAAFCAAVFLVGASGALAYQEPNTMPGTGCSGCHPRSELHPAEGGPCEDCHADYTFNDQAGPHDNYTTTSTKCRVCHTVHAAAAGSSTLLPASTVSATCFTCHDGTGGWGVYGTVLSRTGTAPQGGHRVETTNTVPGGDPNTGGPSSATFRGQSGNLTCSDCHSPHSADVVAPFYGDRRRVRGERPSPLSSKLLKKQPTGATGDVDQYGSDWCAGCHKGRPSGGAVHNHPADTVVNRADAFTYSNVAILASDDPTRTTVLSGMGGVDVTDMHWPTPPLPGNRGYLMPYPRTSQQAGHYPICQQCHEDTREPGELSADGTLGDAAAAIISKADGKTWTGSWTDAADNPLLQNFPHETQNDYMLVEQDDDLCLNCHPTAALP